MGNELILIVEDEPSIRESITENLTLQGYSVIDAQNGQIALDTLNDSHRPLPDLIVCDIMMPEIDGFAVLEQVRSNPKLNHIPFIFLTARVDHQTMRQCMEMGADDFLTKPFTYNELIEAVQGRLEKTTQLRKLQDNPQDIPTMENIAIPNVILVDDVRATIDLLAFLFEEEGFSVKKMSRGQTLLDFAQSFSGENLPVVWLDHHLADMTSLDILPQIRKIPRWRYAPIVVFSGLDIRNEALANGANDFVLKPVEPELLVDMTRRLLNPPLPHEINLKEDNAITEEPLSLASSSSEAVAHILIVDDIPETRETLRRLLTWNAHFQISQTVDGQDALEKVQANPPDLIFMDINMPRMDGLTATEKIHAIPELAHIPIVIVSVQNDADYMRRAMLAGAKDFLSKPVNMEELTNTVSHLLAIPKAVVDTIEPQAEEEEPNDTALVLIVDDDPEVANSLQRVMEREGHKTIIANSGKIGYERALELKPDLILMDVIMPEMDGITTLQKIRQTPSIAYIPVILCTAKGSSEDILDGYVSGADEYIIKPFELLDLRARVAHQLQQRTKLKNRGKLDYSKQGISKILLFTDTLDAPLCAMLNQFLAPIILMISNDIPITERFERFFQHYGYQTRVMADVPPPIAIVEQLHPQGIILKISSLEPGDTATLKQLRERPALRNIPIFAYSPPGNDNILDIKEVFNLGVDDYLPGRIEYGLLATRLARHVLLSHSKQSVHSTFLQDTNKHEPILVKQALYTNYLSTIATSRSNCIVLIEGFSKEHIIALRDFDLSSHLPIVAVVHEPMPFDVWLKLIKVGADEVVISESELVAMAIEVVISQYTMPSLVQTGRAWNVLIAGPDFDLRTDAADAIEAVFHVHVIDADSKKLCIELAKDETPDLLIIDNTLDGMAVVRELRQIDITAPIILLVKEHIPFTAEHYILNIRGLVPYEHIANGMVSTIERLLRWGRERRPLHTSWADYHIRATEADFERFTREIMPVVAATFEETGKLFSGLIHDLRNALFSLSSQLEDLPDNQRTLLQSEFVVASILLETVAEGRFKGTWNVEALGWNEVNTLLEQAVTTIKALRTDVIVDVEERASRYGNYLLDRRQFRQMMTNLLMATLEYTSQVTLRFAEDTVFIVGDNVNKLPLDADALAEDTNTSLHSLIAIKLARRLNMSITDTEDGLKLQFNERRWRDDEALRIEIAQDAKLAQETDTIIANLPKTNTSPKLAELIAPVALTLANFLQFFADNVVRVVPDAEQLIITSRYAILLAHNLLITSAGYKPKLKPVELQPILDTLIKLREDYLKHCTVDISVAPGTPPALADELALLQILVNLVTNAVEAMDGKGRLSIRVSPHTDGIEIRVSDNGPGIPLDQQMKVFDLFFTTKRGHERGVGLHIVHSIVREIGGEIQLDSTPGRGTTFILVIPAAEIKNHDE